MTSDTIDEPYSYDILKLQAEYFTSVRDNEEMMTLVCASYP
jgi:hypothetical protein